MSFSVNQGSRKGKRSRRMKAEINMTPMIDVMLVLLIIFMVSAPMMTSGIPIDLPKVGGKNLSGADTSINISVDREGYFYIGKTEIPSTKIVEKVKAITSNNMDLTVTISADSSAEYGRVIGLMALLKEAGFEKVGLKTESKPAVKR